MDRAWWKLFFENVRQIFRGESYSTCKGVGGPKFIERGKMGNPGNSGAGAILLADYFGAQRILLLGYDCHKKGGAHHHGDHPRGLGNAGSILKWPQQFAAVKKFIKADVVNCSPGTALGTFPCGDLRSELDR